MSIRVSCPSCTAVIKAPEKRAGERIFCPRCGQQVEVPFQMSVSPPSRPPPPSPAPMAPQESRLEHEPVDVDEEDFSGPSTVSIAKMGLLAAISVGGIAVGIVLLIVVTQKHEQKPPAPAKQVASRAEERRQSTREPRREMIREVIGVKRAEEETAPRNQVPANEQEKNKPAADNREPVHPAGAAQPRKDKPANTDVPQASKDKVSETKEAVVPDLDSIDAGPPQESSDKAKTGKPKENPNKAQQDLPDVALVIPEDARPEVKAIIKENVINLRSKNVSDRIKAAQVLGELREEGKPVRGLLCRAMLDRSVKVRVAAADALKNIDPKMQYLAVTLVMEKSAGNLMALLGKIQNLEEDGEPLAPLVAQGTINSAKANDVSLISSYLTTLSHIARNDLASYNLIALALASPSPQIRLIAVQGLARMKHGKLAVPKMLQLLKTETPENRVVVIQALTTLADESTEEVIAAAITAQRYHPEEIVRRAVETALNKLENKKKP